MKGKLANGFEFTVAEGVIDSWAFLKALNAADKNKLRVVDVTVMLLGPEQEEALVKHLGGNPSAEQMENAVFEIFTVIKESQSKNS